MKKIIILLCLVLITAFLATPTSAIFNGELDTEHTNVGAIVIEWPEQYSVNGDTIVGRLCSATLIHEQVLVTAAHCIQPLDIQEVSYDDVWITFNQDATNIPEDPDNDPDYLDVKSWKAHEDYEFQNRNSHDIALVILADPVTEEMGIFPKALPDEGYMNNVHKNLKGKNSPAIQMMVVGYGTTKNMSVPEYIEDADRHFGMVSLENLLPLYTITYQDDSLNNARTCNGDSGGPLFHIDQQGNETLVGLLSTSSGEYGDIKCEIGNMFHYRLDTEDAQDWINGIMSDLELEFP
ncbi:MAG: trypsin-like serine protease [Anaerolineales bacterium]